MIQIEKKYAIQAVGSADFGESWLVTANRALELQLKDEDKANMVVVNGSTMTIAAAKELYEETKGSYDWFHCGVIWSSVVTPTFLGKDGYTYSPKQPKLKLISWHDVPTGTIVNVEGNVNTYMFLGVSSYDAKYANIYNKSLVTSVKLSRLTIGTPSDKDWIHWVGGECPISDCFIFDAQFRSGQVFKELSDASSQFSWTDESNSSDIIAYRITGLADGYGYK